MKKKLILITTSGKCVAATFNPLTDSPSEIARRYSAEKEPVLHAYIVDSEVRF